MREPNLKKPNALVGKLVGDLGISLGGGHTARISPRALQGDGGRCQITPSELRR